ncbi:hypothetical protein Tco_0944662, partial [Tanacetum coccineum]
KIGFASKPKKKFIKKLSKKALSKEVFKQWDGVESDIHNDHIQILHMQTEIAKEQDNEPGVIFEKGESSMPNIGEYVDVLVDEDNIIEDVQVDMGDFRRKYNKNSKWEGFIEHQIEKNDDFEDEELNLEDFDSETDCEGDVEAERNKALRKGQLYKECLWKCATSTTIQYFDKNMDELKDTCRDAYEWLKKISVVHWSRSHFSSKIKCKAHCDVMLNNMCQVEMDWDDKYPGDGKINDILVNLHAVAAINDMGNNGMVIVNGRHYWPKSSVPIELIPPKHHPQVGRPPKKRKKSAMEVEEMVKHGKLTRA